MIITIIMNYASDQNDPGENRRRGLLKGIVFADPEGVLGIKRLRTNPHLQLESASTAPMSAAESTP